MAEEPIVAIILFFVGFLVGIGLLAAGRYDAKNPPPGEGYIAVKGNAFLMEITGYAIAGFCFIGLVRTIIPPFDCRSLRMTLINVFMPVYIG